MNRRKGSLTIEAAIILPIFIVSIMSMLYFIKVIYIQDQIQSAITITAHNIGTHAYLMDKIGLVDAQQVLLNNGRLKRQNTEGIIEEISKNADNLQENIKGMTSFAGESQLDIRKLPSISKEANLKELVVEVENIVLLMPGYILAISKEIDSIVTSINKLVEEGVSNVSSIAVGELLEYTNSAITSRLVSETISHHISNEQLEKWHIVKEDSYIDFDDSSYMLIDDTVRIVARYKIGLPFIKGIYIPIYQSVVVRAFTGSYDYESKSKRVVPKYVDNKESEIYYTTETSECYHVYSCLRNDLTTSYYKNVFKSEKDSRCKICESNGLFYQIDDYEKIYYTTRSIDGDYRTIHVDPMCISIYKKDVIAVTVDEAVSMGKRACTKYHCVNSVEWTNP